MPPKKKRRPAQPTASKSLKVKLAVSKTNADARAIDGFDVPEDEDMDLLLGSKHRLVPDFGHEEMLQTLTEITAFNRRLEEQQSRDEALQQQLEQQEQQGDCPEVEEQQNLEEEELHQRMLEATQKITEDTVVDLFSTYTCRVLQSTHGGAHCMPEPEEEALALGLLDGTLLATWILDTKAVPVASLQAVWRLMAMHPDPTVVDEAYLVISELQQLAMLDTSAAANIDHSMAQPMPQGHGDKPLEMVPWLFNLLEIAFRIPLAALQSGAPVTGTLNVETGMASLQAHNLKQVIDSIAQMIHYSSASTSPQQMQKSTSLIPRFTDDELISLGIVLSYLTLDETIQSQPTVTMAMLTASIGDCLKKVLNALKERAEAMLPGPPVNPSQAFVDHIASCFESHVPDKALQGLSVMPHHPLIWSYVYRLLDVAQLFVFCRAQESNLPAPEGDVFGKLGAKPSKPLLLVCQLLKQLTMAPELRYAQWAISVEVLRRLQHLSGDVDPSHVVRITLTALQPLLEAEHHTMQVLLASGQRMRADQSDLMDAAYVALMLCYFAVPQVAEHTRLDTRGAQHIAYLCNGLTKYLQSSIEYRFNRLPPILELIQAALLPDSNQPVQSPRKMLRQSKLDFHN